MCSVHYGDLFIQWDVPVDGQGGKKKKKRVSFDVNEVQVQGQLSSYTI